MTKESQYITVNGTAVKSPVFLASMAGITDAAYVKERADSVGGAFIGGYSIDDTTRSASKEMEACGRAEFDASLEDIKAELESLRDTGLALGVNLRGTTAEAYLAAAECFGHDVICEIDAHCRQKPMTAAGAGEALLSDIPADEREDAINYYNDYCFSLNNLVGVTKKFLGSECKKAYEGLTTPPCNQKCSGCGVTSLCSGDLCPRKEACK